MRPRKLCAAFLTLFMLLMLMPVSTHAASLPGLDFTLDVSDPEYPGESGAGWAWDSSLKTLTLDGFSYMKADGTDDPALLLPADSTIVLAPGSENELEAVDGPGIVVYGDLDIKGNGSLSITSDGNGIRAVGDLAISGVAELEINSSAMGMRVGPGASSDTGDDGNLTITDCGDIKIASADDGMRVIGNLDIDMLDSIEIKIEGREATGIRVGPGYNIASEANGDAVIANVGQLVIVSTEWNGSGIRISGDLLLNKIGVMDITSDHTSIRVGPGDPEWPSQGDLLIVDCAEVSIASTRHTGIRVTGNLVADSVSLMQISANHMGMRVGSSYHYALMEGWEGWSSSDAEGYVHLINSNVEIAATQAAIRSNGAIWTYQSSLMVFGHDLENGEKVAPDYGLYAAQGDIVIERSNVDVSAYLFALVTGFVCGTDIEEESGGDIIIYQSFVKAEVESELGLAAIFAGDNLEPDADGHAKIILEKAFISVPDEAYIVDVNIAPPANGIALQCQSITGDSEVEVITSLEQALNYVEIEPYYYVAYNPNGGTGEMPDEGPYTSGSNITLLGSEFMREGYLFIGWNTLADGSGTMYLPGQEIPLNDDLTLYAQYEPISVEEITNGEDDADETENGDESDTDEPENGDESDTDEPEHREPIPETGDSSMRFLFYTVLTLLSAVIFLLHVKQQRKSRKQDA